MKLIVPITMALALLVSAPALATGTVKIQQNDNTVQTYENVSLRIANNALTLTSPDKVSTVVITGANCDHGTGLVRCTGGQLSLKQAGATHVVPFKSATFYFNLTDQDQALPLSTLKVAPHSVIFVAHTAKGTYITGNGTLDQEPAK